jgi:hypothetical protein
VDGGDQGDAKEGKRLIEIVEPSGDRGKKDETTSNALPKLKGILKQSGSTNITGATTKSDDAATRSRGSSQASLTKPKRPTWSWRKEADERLMIIIDVPKEVRSCSVFMLEADDGPLFRLLTKPSLRLH